MVDIMNTTTTKTIRPHDMVLAPAARRAPSPVTVREPVTFCPEDMRRTQPMPAVSMAELVYGAEAR